MFSRLLPICILLFISTSCTGPDERMRKAIATLDQVQKAEAQNKDRIWQSLIANWRKSQERRIEAAYAASKVKAEKNRPPRPKKTGDIQTDLTNLEQYMIVDIPKYMEKKSAFMAKLEFSKTKKYAELDLKAAKYQDGYDKTKANVAAQQRLTALLMKYESARLDVDSTINIAEKTIDEIIELSKEF